MDKTGILKSKNEIAFIDLNSYTSYTFLRNRQIKLKFLRLQ